MRVVACSVVAPLLPILAAAAPAILKDYPVAPPDRPWDFFVPPTYDYCQAAVPYAADYTPLKDADLEYVQLVIRHGDRTPLHTYRGDNSIWDDCNDNFDAVLYSHKGRKLPLKSHVAVQQRVYTAAGAASFGYAMYAGNCEFGGLTDKGKRMHVDLGSHLRDIYVHKLGYLPKHYKRGSIYLRSTNVWRTKNSAESLITGLYPTEYWPNREYIPMYTLPQRLENMSPNRGQCPLIARLTSAMENTTTYQNYLVDVAPFNSKMASIVSLDNSYSGFSYQIGYSDFLMTRLCHNKPFPCASNVTTDNHGGSLCISEDDARQALKNSFFEYSWPKRDGPQADLFNTVTIGSFLNDLASELRSVINGKAHGHHFSLYSGHDDTISSLLGVLKADDANMMWPPYRSNMIFELWKKKTKTKQDQLPAKYVVRIIYNGQFLTFQPGHDWCDSRQCDINSFLAKLDYYVPKNLEQQCLMVPQ